LILVVMGCSPKNPVGMREQDFFPANYAHIKGMTDPPAGLYETVADSLTMRFTPGDSLEISWPAGFAPESPEGDGMYLQLRLYPAPGWLGSRPLWGVFARPLLYGATEGVPAGVPAELDSCLTFDGGVLYNPIQDASSAYVEGRYIVTVPMEAHTAPRALWGWYDALTVANCPDCQVIERRSKFNFVLDPTHKLGVVPE
jgi:hypothetical protein